jgi:hypothetical protein
MKYTIKYWKHKRDYDKGNAIIKGTNYEQKEVMTNAGLLLLNNYAVEVFETESGNTYYSSIEE